MYIYSGNNRGNYLDLNFYCKFNVQDNKNQKNKQHESNYMYFAYNQTLQLHVLRTTHSHQLRVTFT